MSAPKPRHLSWTNGAGAPSPYRGKTFCGLTLNIEKLWHVKDVKLVVHGGTVDPTEICAACRAAWVAYKLGKPEPGERERAQLVPR